MAIILNPRFPAPDRSSQKVHLTRDQHGVADLGWCEGVLKDGRPFRAETWVQDQITMVTIFFSALGIENMNSDEMTSMIDAEGLVAFKPGRASRGAEYRKYTDTSGNAMWSVNIAVGVENNLYVTSVVPYFPYLSSREPPSLFQRNVGSHTVVDNRA